VKEKLNILFFSVIVILQSLLFTLSSNGSTALGNLNEITVNHHKPSLNVLDQVEDFPSLLSWVIHEIELCPTPCDIQLDQSKKLLIQAEPLGIGERGIVFRVLNLSEPSVLKIAKPEPMAIEMLRNEVDSNLFWHHQAEFSKHFQAKLTLWTHPQGLFALMPEGQGTTLTDSLFELGLLEINPLTNEVKPNLALVDKNQNQVDKIWLAVNEMKAIINEHPEMRTSLSPNNLFVTKNSNGSIKDLTLIDFGVDTKGDLSYTQLESFNDYLVLCAKKITGYTQKPSYTSASLFPLQSKAKKLYGYPSLFDNSPFLELIEQALRVMKVRGHYNLNTDLAEILEFPLQDSLTLKVAFDGVALPVPETLGELERMINTINYKLKTSKSKIVSLTIDGQEFRVQLPALGEGDRGTVYALVDRDQVIKIPKSGLISIFTLMNEQKGYEFWFSQSLKKESSFSVPHREFLHPLGAYSIIARDYGEPLTKTLLRFGIIQVDKTTGKALINPLAFAKLGASNYQKIEKAILSIKKIIAQNPKYALSYSPNNLHVQFVNADKTIVSDVVLIDVGLGNKNSSKFDAIIDFKSYVEFSLSRIEKYYRLGYLNLAEIAEESAKLALEVDSIDYQSKNRSVNSCQNFIF
jgi:hypothetical protein